MRYWWVNQNQTYRHEIGNGYMWLPKKQKDGKSQISGVRAQFSLI